MESEKGRHTDRDKDRQRQLIQTSRQNDTRLQQQGRMKQASMLVTLSSQSSLTAMLLGFRSYTINNQTSHSV